MKKLKNFFYGLSLQAKISSLYSLIMLISLFLTLLVTFQICYSNLSAALDNTLRNTAIMVSHNTAVIQALEKNQPTNDVNAYCDAALHTMKNVDIITICNPEGTRIYHRDKEKIGQHIVGGDEGRMMETHENYFNTAYGTLGRQRRYFHPINNSQGQFIGFVCVSVLAENLELIKNKILMGYFVVAIAAFCLIILSAAKLHMILKNVLFGYEPEQIAKMIIQHQEVLNSLGEGILAIDSKGCVTLLNSAAIQMLNITVDKPEGKPVLEVFPESLLPRTLQTRQAERNVNLKLRNIHLITSRIPVIEKGELIGAVSIFRNQTEVIQLSEKLTGVNHMVEAMRAYTHEFTNKLHVILGLLECREYQKAAEYITHVSNLQKTKIGFIMKTIKLPKLCALLVGKLCRANELDIAFEIDENSFVDEAGAFLPVNAVSTIIGNLLENSMESINTMKEGPREIHLSLFYDASAFICSISDTGAGISKEILHHIFEDGFSTKGPGRGKGLTLVKELVDLYHGTIQVNSEKDNGTIFTISIENKEQEEQSND